MRLDLTKYLLRWRFEYSDGKRDKIGMWSQASNSVDQMASFQSKENLLYAYIEGKCRETRAIIPFVDIAGQDFVNFEWIAEVDGISSMAAGVSDYRTGATRIIGLKAVTRNQKISAFANGQVVCESFDGSKESFNLEQYRV